ncbi:DNA gyrase inhibitor YacG [Morganella morganii]|nr:DNA gyrase inhibitor YacG [Morganella morganii]
MSEAIIVNCPNCKKEVVWGPESPYRPFCSKRCQLIDLGSGLRKKNGLPVRVTFLTVKPGVNRKTVHRTD